MAKTFKGHSNAVSAVAFHPKKQICATASDDETWKLWAMPSGDLIMSGEGHKDWLSGLQFHPRGSHLATAAGDGTVKLWDFASASCVATYTDHTQPVWSVDFHHSGVSLWLVGNIFVRSLKKTFLLTSAWRNVLLPPHPPPYQLTTQQDFIASSSMDHTAKLWDVNSQRCRQTFRGHVDSVNSIVFRPFSNVVCTASGDKTISLWDVRSGLCVQTFYGHLNAANSAQFNMRGDTVASCDADGVVKVWDVRQVAERQTLSGGQHPLNQLSFDRSGTIVAAACDDGTVKVFDLEGGEDKIGVHAADLRGHEDAVQSVMFEPGGKYIMSGASDCTFRVWSMGA